MNVWKSWAESKGRNNDIVKYTAKELDDCLSQFFAEIRKSDGSDYKPDGSSPLSWVSGYNNLWSWRLCFSSKPFHFTAAVTTKTVI